MDYELESQSFMVDELSWKRFTVRWFPAFLFCEAALFITTLV